MLLLFSAQPGITTRGGCATVSSLAYQRRGGMMKLVLGVPADTMSDLFHHLDFTDVRMVTDSGTAQQSFLLADGLPDVTDAVKTVDSEIAQQSFLVAAGFDMPNIPKPSDTMVRDILKADLDEVRASIDNDLDGVKASIDKLKASIDKLKASIDNDLDGVKASIDKLIYAGGVALIAGGVAWLDLKQGIAGLLNEQQERILPDVTTELTVDAGNLAVIVVSAPKRLRGFKKKSFTLKSKNEGKVLLLTFSHEGVVETWQQHLPATKIVELEELKKGLRYTFTKEDTASDTNSPRAELRIELTKPLAPRP